MLYNYSQTLGLKGAFVQPTARQSQGQQGGQSTYHEIVKQLAKHMYLILSSFFASKLIFYTLVPGEQQHTWDKVEEMLVRMQFKWNQKIKDYVDRGQIPPIHLASLCSSFRAGERHRLQEGAAVQVG